MPDSQTDVSAPAGSLSADLTTGFISPELVIRGWGISEGEKVADLGCGGGYFTIPAARIVGEKGRVFAVDVMEGPIEAVRSNAYLEKLSNVEVIRANLEKKNSLAKWIKKNDCQWVILANILYTTKKQKSIIQEAKRILTPKGKLVVVDWIKNVGGAFRNFGPPMELRIDKEETKSLISKEGFTFKDDFEAGQFHFGIIFSKKRQR